MDTHKIGNVIRIINNRSLIIDAGSDIVSVGDKIKVYEATDTLKNLDGTTLAVFEYTKDELEVVDVEESYSVCQKNKTKTVPSPSQLAISPLLGREEQIPLNVDPNDIEPIQIHNGKICIGDPVKFAWHYNCVMVRWDE